MTTQDFRDEQIVRMSGLAGFPQEEAGIKELSRALAEAETEHQAREAVTNLIDSMEFCPKPAHILEAIGAAPLSPGPCNPRADCTLCGGLGWVMKKQLVKGPFGEQSYGSAGRCECVGKDLR